MKISPLNIRNSTPEAVQSSQTDKSSAVLITEANLIALSARNYPFNTSYVLNYVANSQARLCCCKVILQFCFRYYKISVGVDKVKFDNSDSDSN